MTEADSETTGAEVSAAEDAGESYDYSMASSWVQIPAVTKDVDTFYILATEYIVSSFDEGASDYAEVGNPEMKEKACTSFQTC